MSKIKESFEELKRKLTEVKASTKRKVGAGILAGSLLFGGLVGCTNGKVSSNEDLNETSDTKVEDIQKSVNIEINNQTSDENFAVVVERIIEVLKEQGASDKDIEEFKEQISGLATKKEINNAFATMQEKLEGMLSDKVDKIIDELGKNNNQDSSSGEASSVVFDAQSAMDVLEQMYRDMVSGASKDYLGNFKNAEKIDAKVKEAFKQGAISKDDFDSVQKCIMVVQAVSMTIEVENALTRTADQTGCF
ncbi:MAG: hypothetical protein J6J23_06190, partial [Clostridia bacterium]|nr:hypothetical protein [Clostridia bacterium]